MGAGVLIDLYFGRRIVVTPSFAPHFYVGGDDDLTWDHPLEFRSQLELAYRIKRPFPFVLQCPNYSNASLGDTNPGTESVRSITAVTRWPIWPLIYLSPIL